MKKFMALFLMLVLALTAFAGGIQAPEGFVGKVWDSTFALYGAEGKHTPQFLCTAEAFQPTRNGYMLLSAGHCVQRPPADLQFSVADYIGGPLTPVTVLKARWDDTADFALFDLQTNKKYFVPGGDLTEPVYVGEPVFYVNFALGLGKQLSLGQISSPILGKSLECSESCPGDFIVQSAGGRGASGSAVISAKTHKLIGIVVVEWDDPVGFGVEPMSKFISFWTSPTQPHPGTGEEEQQ